MAFATVRLIFDNGTILLRDPPPGMDLSSLPGVIWDPRVEAHRAPACRHRALVSELERRSVSFSDEVQVASPGPTTWSNIELRPYQEAALFAWEMAGRRALIALPTGAGKTRVAMAAMSRSGLRTLCLVPTRALLEQWKLEIERAYARPVGCYGDGSHELAAVTVATFESGYRHMHHLGNRFDMLVVDEAHHFGCGLRDEALEMCVAEARLGLTATPPHDRTTLERLGELVGPIAYELTIGDLAGRFLSSFELVTLHLGLTRDERVAYETSMKLFRDFHGRFRRLAPTANWQDLVRAAARTNEGRRALEAFRRVGRLLAFTQNKRQVLRSLLQQHRERRTLVFTADNETAYSVATEHLVMPLTCDIGRTERKDVLSRFATGELRVLVSARVLNEGIDLPDADVAIIVAGTQGAREHVQRVGRLLRPREGKRALVYELVTRGTIEVRQAKRRRAGLTARIARSA